MCHKHRVEDIAYTLPILTAIAGCVTLITCIMATSPICSVSKVVEKRNYLCYQSENVLVGEQFYELESGEVVVRNCRRVSTCNQEECSDLVYGNRTVYLQGSIGSYRRIVSRSDYASCKTCLALIALVCTGTVVSILLFFLSAAINIESPPTASEGYATH